MLTRERLKELLDFDESTGRFYWRTSRGGWGAGREAGSVKHDGYRRIGIDFGQYHAQDLVWLWVHGELPDFLLDHRNRDRDDNRPENLRRATHSQNLANTGLSPRNTSGFKGASKIRGQDRWLATIKVNGKSRYLGTYGSPSDAHKAYMEAAREAFGEFARAS